MVPVFYEIFDDFEQWLKRKLARFITPQEDGPKAVAPTASAAE